MDEYAAFGLLAGFGIAIVVIVLIAIACYVVYVIGLWKVFTKAGVEGWKAIIPVLNVYEIYKMSWETKFFWIYLVLDIIVGATANSDGFLSIIGTLCSVGVFVFTIMMNYYLAKSFGQSTGFTVGLVFLPVIFVPLLGFGAAQYEGNGAQIAAAEKSGSVPPYSQTYNNDNDPMGPTDSSF